MEDFSEKMDALMKEDFSGYGDNGYDYTVENRMRSDPDMKLMHKLNIPLIRHLAERMDYDGIGKYICGVINQQAADHD